MDLSTNLFYQVNLVIFLCFTCCHPVASIPISSSKVNNILDAIVACDSIKFLRNSSYVSQCNTSYPVDFKQNQADKDINFMCMTLNHITNKICEYHVIDKTQLKMPETASKFDEEMKKLEPRKEDRPKIVEGWCQNMTVLLNASILNDSNTYYIEYANQTLLDKTECIATCHIRGGVNHFCVVFFWFNQLYNTLQLSKKINISKEIAISKPEVPHEIDKIEPDDNVEKPLINADNNDEHANVVNTKDDKEQTKLQIPDADIQNNLKAEPVGNTNEQEIKKPLDQSDHEIITDKQQQRQDPKLSSTADKLNTVESKIENPKMEFQEGNNSFLDEEGKKPFDEAAEGDNDHGIMETNKKDSYSDPGDQRGFLDSPIIKEEDESHFFIYFSIISFICVMLYIGYHNKQKILAMVLEGRQSRRSRSTRRRPNTANYRKLDSNLEEAVTSQCNSNVTHVIY